ncbi:Phosphatidylinositol 4-phosphate 5-kinase 6 [Pelomyxa schiedti]|nr:Phosphatidylinositol 4-phosphate 5-kinase 6 [Pelomyxa schiedti]
MAQSTRVFVDNLKWTYGVYCGQAVNNRPDGCGKLVWQVDGFTREGTYVGEWKDGVREGQGAATWPDGGTYYGQWQSDTMRGNGVLRHGVTGDITWGQFANGCCAGTGRMFLGENSPQKDPGGSYVGQVNDGKFHGNGVRLWSNGNSYEGQWEGDKENGAGKKRWSRDGSTFTGVWKNGVPVKGTMEWPNGDKFTGTFTHATGEQEEIYHGEGALSLSPSTDPGVDCQFNGTLKGNTFHGTDGAALHLMGSSLPQLGHSQLIQKLNQKSEAERTQWNDENQQLQKKLNVAEEKIKELNSTITQLQQQFILIDIDKASQSEALHELQEAFGITTQIRSKLKNAVPQLISLEESVSRLKELIPMSTGSNKSLEVHLNDLVTLREVLSNEVNESERRCKELLGQTLTVRSSQSEIHQCSKNINSLIKRLITIKPSDNPEGERQVPSKDTKNLLTLKPWRHITELPPSPPPFFFDLTELTTASVIMQGACKFDRCANLTNENAQLREKYNTQVTQNQMLQKEVEEACAACHKLTTDFQHKFMLRSGLEGDEKFMSHPDVLPDLAELLPHAQQALMDILLSMSIAPINTPATPPPPPPSTTPDATTLPGCTAQTKTPTYNITSSSNNNQQPGTCKVCEVCEDRPPDLQFHPCGHCICCSAVLFCPHTYCVAATCRLLRGKPVITKKVNPPLFV